MIWTPEELYHTIIGVFSKKLKQTKVLGPNTQVFPLRSLVI